LFQNNGYRATVPGIVVPKQWILCNNPRDCCTVGGYMIHIGTLNIETERLLLRRFVQGDAPYIFRNWARDPEVSRHLTWMAHDNVENTEKVLQMWLDSYDRPEIYNWAIVDKESGQPIGSIAVVAIYEEADKCEIGYCLGRKYWGKGIMTEAFKAVMDFLFNQVGFNRIQAYHHVDNPASGRVMMKAGMKKEGQMRQFARSNKGDFVDVDFYGITKDEFVV